MLVRVCTIFFLIAAVGSLTACTGRNIHKSVIPDPKVLVREWTFSTRNDDSEAGDRGFEYSNPVIFENTLIFGTQGKGLISMYPGLVQTRWVLPIPNGVVSPPTLENRTVYVGGGDGFLYSVNAENGAVNWRYDIHNPQISAPTVQDGRLFITTTDDTVYAFDANTGKWLWHYRRRSAPLATTLGASKPLVDGNDLLVGLSDGFLVTLSVNDGSLKWEKKLHQGTKFTDVDAYPVLDDGIIYVPSYDGALYALKRSNGDTVWRFDSGGGKRAVVEDEMLYLPASDGYVYALQKSNAKVVWKFELDRGVPTRLAMIGTDKIAVGSSFQYLYVLDKRTGTPTYRFNAGYDNGFSGAPLFDATTQRLFLLSGAGNLYAFSVTQPSQKNRPHGMTDPFSFR